jgi:ubiquinone/menaquinone biosynthesis C-methylase UbiE
VASDAELGELKDRARSGWDGANYAALAERLMPVARDLVDACAVSAGQDVLDVAAGNGNAAAAAAAEGARVVASDFSPGQVERGRERTAAEGLDVHWVVADVEELPFDDGSFDCVVSVFGAMFGLRPDRVGQELFRVLRPGGTVGLASWGSGGFQSEFFATLRRYRPIMPEGVPPPLLWGQEDVVRDRLGELAGSIEFERPSLRWEFASTQEMAQFTRDAGPRDMEDLPEDQVRELLRELAELAERYNTADDGSVRIDAEYLRVVARKRG